MYPPPRLPRWASQAGTNVHSEMLKTYISFSGRPLQPCLLCNASVGKPRNLSLEGILPEKASECLPENDLFRACQAVSRDYSGLPGITRDYSGWVGPPLTCVLFSSFLGSAFRTAFFRFWHHLGLQNGIPRPPPGPLFSAPNFDKRFL